jgi:hypothetical protein
MNTPKFQVGQIVTVNPGPRAERVRVKEVLVGTAAYPENMYRVHDFTNAYWSESQLSDEDLSPLTSEERQLIEDKLVLDPDSPTTKALNRLYTLHKYGL